MHTYDDGTLFTNSVAIYGFVMHSSVFAHIGCVDDMNARQETFANDINIAAAAARHHHNANGVKHAIHCGCGNVIQVYHLALHLAATQIVKLNSPRSRAYNMFHESLAQNGQIAVLNSNR